MCAILQSLITSLLDCIFTSFRSYHTLRHLLAHFSFPATQRSRTHLTMPNKRHTYTILSAIYLLALTVVAAWALHRTQIHRLPIPTTLAAFTLALPAITGLALEALTGTANNNRTIIRWSPRLGSQNTWSQYAITALFILETVLATLAGTYIAPAGALRCGLDDRWRELYRAKNGKIIGRIQDAFQCCGLHSVVDMAYPFPSKDRTADACKVMYGRQWSCFDSWREDERIVAALILAVTAGVAAWKVNAAACFLQPHN